MNPKVIRTYHSGYYKLTATGDNYRIGSIYHGCALGVYPNREDAIAIADAYAMQRGYKPDSTVIA